MERVLLERFESGDQGTFGRLSVGDLVLFTLELPWRENQSDHSCIPEGEYQCMWTMSAHFHRGMYLVSEVPDRAGIRIHSANLAGDRDLGYRAQLNGCIALGESLGSLDGQKALLSSAPAVRQFVKLLGQKPFTLEIRNGSA